VAACRGDSSGRGCPGSALGWAGGAAGRDNNLRAEAVCGIIAHVGEEGGFPLSTKKDGLPPNRRMKLNRLASEKGGVPRPLGCARRVEPETEPPSGLA